MLKLKIKYIPLIITYLVFAPNPSFFSANAQYDEVFLPVQNLAFTTSTSTNIPSSTPKSTSKPAPKKAVTKIKSPGKVIKEGYGLAFWDETKAELNFKPKPPKHPNDRHSALFVSDQKLKQPYEISFSVVTAKQLREDPDPSEVGWFVFGYKQRDAFKYMVLKPNGYGLEIGELLPGEEMVYLFTTPRNTYDFPVGSKYDITLKVKDNLVAVSINGQKNFEYLMNKNDTLPANGQFGFYAENAEVVFSNIKTKQL